MCERLNYILFLPQEGKTECLYDYLYVCQNSFYLELYSTSFKLQLLY